MKTLHVLRVTFALFFLSHFSHANTDKDDPLCEPQARTATVGTSTCDQFIVFPIKIMGYFAKTTGMTFGQGVKSLCYSAYGYECGAKVDRWDKFKNGMSFTLGAPLLSLVFTGGYAYSLYNGGRFG
ncbi:MAG: hypothetical protein NTW22_00215 [Proteobacteria bacterium]|nr:hypothetical protein [Pseudomonadota bacterium]